MISARDRYGGSDVVRAHPKPKKRKGRSERQKAETYADQWLREMVILRDRRCITCGAPAVKDERGHWWAARSDGRTVVMDPSHVFRRTRGATRWTPDNVHAQCRVCHAFHHHQDEHPLRNYAYRLLGQDRMDELYRLSRTTTDFSVGTIKAFGDSFRAKCREMDR